MVGTLSSMTVIVEGIVCLTGETGKNINDLRIMSRVDIVPGNSDGNAVISTSSIRLCVISMLESSSEDAIPHSTSTRAIWCMCSSKSAERELMSRNERFFG